jgi:hypothetical protein
MKPIRWTFEKAKLRAIAFGSLLEMATTIRDLAKRAIINPN